MKRFIAVLAAVALLAIGATFVTAAGPDTITLEGGKMGQITFPHSAHQERVDNCTTCHHNGLKEPKCTSCHGVEEDAPKAKDAFHKVCKDCHKDQGGPTGCRDCHKK